MRVSKNAREAGGSFKPLPAGWYLCEIENVEEKTTQAGDAMWHIVFVVKTAVGRIASEGYFEGRKLFDNLVWNEKGEPRIVRLMHRLGYSTDTDLTTRHLLGKELLVEVDIEVCQKGKNTGKKQNKVTFGGYDFADPADKLVYEQRKELAHATGKPTPPPPPQRQRERQPGEDDDSGMGEEGF